jgi:hypothetical protein
MYRAYMPLVKSYHDLLQGYLTTFESHAWPSGLEGDEVSGLHVELKSMVRLASTRMHELMNRKTSKEICKLMKV